MSEYWKSTPSYWCKFCSRYVRDSAIEKRNHEASAQHQNNIQRSLRDLHKSREREERDKQRAKDEVARLKGEKIPPRLGPVQSATQNAPAVTSLTAAQQRKAHAEQLAAMGVKLSADLQKEVTGVGDFQVVNQREIRDEGSRNVTVARSMADILAEERARASAFNEDEEDPASARKKRKIKDSDGSDENTFGEGERTKSKAWGSRVKTYVGAKPNDDRDAEDLDSLLTGISSLKQEPVVKAEKIEGGNLIKKEKDDEDDESHLIDAAPDGKTVQAFVKQEDTDATVAPSAVIFKKRKGKK